MIKSEAPAAPKVQTSLPVSKELPFTAERRWLGTVPVALFLLALFIPPVAFGGDRYWMPLFNKYVAIAIFALSVDLIWGYTGLLSLGQGLYFGLGAYAMGYCLKLQKTAQVAGAPPGTVMLPDFMEYCRLPAVPEWIAPLVDTRVAIVAAILLPTLAALVFGAVTFRMRIRGVYFSLITQALVLAV